MTDDKRKRAYQAASHLTREGLRRDAPERAAVLDAVVESDVIVVSGIYDHVEDVLDALDVRHTVVAPPDLDRVELRPEQLLVVNCPGQVSPRAVSRVRAFVETGGSLFTTDWALRHIVEAAFPGVLAFNERPTGDDVVRVEVRDPDDVYVGGVMDGRDDPQWWLEASSYPIRILDPSRVQVLITSRELGARYGEEPVAVRFGWGEGEVFHMISHYYLQRTQTRTIRHQAAAGEYFAEKGVALEPAMATCLQDLTVADVESARASSAFMSNIVIDKKARAQRTREDPPGARRGSEPALRAVRRGGTCVYCGSTLVSAVPISGKKTPTRSGEMNDTHRDDETREAVAERTNMGRYLAIGFVALWLVTLLTLVGHVGVGGF